MPTLDNDRITEVGYQAEHYNDIPFIKSWKGMLCIEVWLLMALGASIDFYLIAHGISITPYPFSLYQPHSVLAFIYVRPPSLLFMLAYLMLTVFIAKGDKWAIITLLLLWTIERGILVTLGYYGSIIIMLSVVAPCIMSLSVERIRGALTRPK